MSKRKLTRRQQWRIDKIQKDKLARAERKQARGADDDEQRLSQVGAEVSARVITHYGQQVEIEYSQDGNQQRCRCHFRANLPPLVVGDHVLAHPPLAAETDSSNHDAIGVITAIEERRTVLVRPDPYGKLKPVAANVEQMIITFALLPTPSSVLLDRYLVAAELSNIKPVLLLNKTDLLDEDAAEVMDELRSLYEPLGYPVLKVSAHTQEGLAPVRELLANSTSVFVGQSGVGKSSLINALLPDADLAVNEVSDTSGLGQHTTVTARLFKLPEGGELIDSPGVREFGLWHISEEELLKGYIDLAPLAGNCRFRNCSHRHEPGCALIDAAENGNISAERLDNFFHIADTLDDDSRQRYE